MRPWCAGDTKFAAALGNSSLLPSCYNGRIFTPDYCVPIAAITEADILLISVGILRFCGPVALCAVGID